jgi:hypothetical protein
MKFLVDTGSSFSLLPYRSSKQQSGPTQRAADGCRIPCWGYSSTAVNLEGTAYTWSFLLPAVRFPILGIDFLRHFCLLVDSSGNPLLRSHPASGHMAAVGSASATPDSGARDLWQTLLQEFPGLSAEMSTSTRPAHGVLHHIETTGWPVMAKFRRLCPKRLAAAKAEFGRMLKAGIICRSHSHTVLRQSHICFSFFQRASRARGRSSKEVFQVICAFPDLIIFK